MIRSRISVLLSDPLFLGVPLIVIGIIFMVLPGPGIIPLVAGLFCLSKKYVWAKSLLFWVLHRLDKLLDLGKRWKRGLCNHYPRTYNRIGSVLGRGNRIHKRKLGTWAVQRFPRFHKSYKRIWKGLRIEEQWNQARQEYIQRNGRN
ncbi:PGPGW domain-containing protein [Pasteuria penetrans]|uniref:PGPGW domain-containing protein n=1 Tax=Pasteuria penetrans TaxID=86005 RepID=UPI0011F02F39